MRLSAALLLAFALFGSAQLILTGCRGVASFSGGVTVVSGTVDTAHLSTIPSNGALIQVTFVSLQKDGVSNQFTFCGNNLSQFPMNTSVTVHFNPGQDCNVIAVVISG